MGDKDSYQALHGVWIYGLDELDSLRRSERTRTKNFLTQTIDRYRPSYGRTTKSVPRQNVFCGTTNEEAYLDDTANRRFWPVRLICQILPAVIAEDRDQLWAEAVARYDSGERWYADTAELRALCEAEQDARRTEDAWVSAVRIWIDRRVDHSAGYSTFEVLTEALEIEPGRVTKSDSMRAANVLHDLGFRTVKRNQVGHVRERRYFR
jgi:putative DNA primase/helicase